MIYTPPKADTNAVFFYGTWLIFNYLFIAYFNLAKDWASCAGVDVKKPIITPIELNLFNIDLQILFTLAENDSIHVYYFWGVVAIIGIKLL